MSWLSAPGPAGSLWGGGGPRLSPLYLSHYLCGLGPPAAPRTLPSFHSTSACLLQRASDHCPPPSPPQVPALGPAEPRQLGHSTERRNLPGRLIPAQETTNRQAPLSLGGHPSQLPREREREIPALGGDPAYPSCDHGVPGHKPRVGRGHSRSSRSPPPVCGSGRWVPLGFSRGDESRKAGHPNSRGTVYLTTGGHHRS